MNATSFAPVLTVYLIEFAVIAMGSFCLARRPALAVITIVLAWNAYNGSMR